jgi:hypothetical protein
VIDSSPDPDCRPIEKGGVNQRPNMSGERRGVDGTSRLGWAGRVERPGGESGAGVDSIVSGTVGAEGRPGAA